MATWKKVVVESTAGNITQKAATSGTADNITSQGALATLGSVAAGQISSNAVTTAKILDANVTTAKIANDAITTDKIADEAVTGDQIEASTISGGHLNQGAINASALLADSVVSAAKIATNAITNAKVADDAIGVAELSATGTASGSTYLRGDNTWAAVSSYSGWNIGSDNNGTLNAAALGVASGEGAHFLGGSGISSATTFPSGTGTVTVTFDVDNTVVRTSGTQSISGNKTFSGDVSVANLTVTGTTTTVNTETLTVDDNAIVLNNNVTGTPNQDGGIIIERGDESNQALAWDESGTRWGAGHSETGTAGGTTFSYSGHLVTVTDPATSSAPTGNGTGVGSMQVNSDNAIYIRVA